MGRFKVCHDYLAVHQTADGNVTVQLDVDTVVELDDGTADLVNRDSPGALRPATARDTKAEAPDGGKAGHRAPAAPPSDRQVKRARRRAHDNTAGDQGPMNSDNFAAVKPKA